LTFTPEYDDSQLSLFSGASCDNLVCERYEPPGYAGEYVFVMKGYYAPVNATKTNMVRHNIHALYRRSKRHVSKSSDLFAKPARLDLDAVAIHQLMSLEKYSAARDVYLNGLNYYDYDDENFGFVSLHNLTQSETIGDTDFDTYQLYTDYLSKNPGYFVDDFILR
jgi:hypothetical protein